MLQLKYAPMPTRRVKPPTAEPSLHRAVEARIMASFSVASMYHNTPLPAYLVVGLLHPSAGSQCNCFIEVSRESRMKYEWDAATNMLKLDRVLHGAAFYPHDYGFIPQTLCGDGDPLVRKRPTAGIAKSFCMRQSSLTWTIDLTGVLWDLQSTRI